MPPPHTTRCGGLKLIASSFDGETLPVWEDEVGYLDPRTGEVLRDLGPSPRRPHRRGRRALHVLTFGDQVDAKGVLAGTPNADQVIRLPVQVPHQVDRRDLRPGQPAPEGSRRPDGGRPALRAVLAHLPELARYGVQPKGAKPGQAPGQCRGKGHKPEHLGYPGRRVLVSRKWSNKTLTEHRADRRAWVLETPRSFGNRRHRPEPLHLATDPTRRPRPSAARTTAPGRDRQPPTLACAPGRTPGPSRRHRSFGNRRTQEGSVMANKPGKRRFGSIRAPPLGPLPDQASRA
ncbi:replication initiator [Nonomuraea dietziae]|uniref:replication initiator n=1 Tax=Nonomuraea dietziae TaxID=65515 RepID=UPI0031D11FA3